MVRRCGLGLGRGALRLFCTLTLAIALIWLPAFVAPNFDARSTSCGPEHTGDPLAHFPSSFARAEGDETREALQIEVSAQPDGLIEPGDVVLNFTITNVSAREVRNVYLSSADGLVSEPVGQIAPGECQSFSRPHSVSAEELDAGEIEYTVSHDDPDDEGAKVNYSVIAPIERQDAAPQAEFTRQFSSRSVAAGATLTVTYRVRNTGNVPLTDLLVQDSLGNFTGRVELLGVGEIRTLINRASVTEATVSSASLSYRTASDEDAQLLRLEDVPVDIAEARLSATFDADRSAFSASVANVVLTLHNDGNVDYGDICVIDDLYGGVIADELTLPAGGEPLEVSRAYKLRGEQGFRWRVTATSASGERADFVTETLHLPAQAQASSDAPRLSARALMPRIRRSGNVKVHISIDNSGGAELRDLTLSEDALGEVHSFAVLSADGAIERDFSVYVDDDASFSFHLSGTNAQGEAVTADAAPVEIVIAQDGELPEGARDTLIDFSGGSIKIGGSSTFAALLIVALALLLGLFVALLIVSHRTKQAELVERARADEAKRRREEMNQTGRLPTAKGTKPKGKGKGAQ